MQLLRLKREELHFPAEEWRWLRPAIEVSAPILARESTFFVYGARIPGESKVWAWSIAGSAIECDASLELPVLVVDFKTKPEAYAAYLKTAFSYREALAIEVENAAGNSKFGFLSLDERKFLFERHWEPTTFEAFESLPTALRESLVKSFARHNLVEGAAKEVVTCAMLLVKKMGEAVALKVATKDYANGEEFRAAFFNTSQPELAQISRERIQKLRELQAPQRTSIFGDPNFEREILKITHTPRNLADFEVFKRWVNEAGTLEKVRELLEIYQ